MCYTIHGGGIHRWAAKASRHLNERLLTSVKRPERKSDKTTAQGNRLNKLLTLLRISESLL